MTLMTEKIRNLFDQALELKEGEFITLPCTNPSQCDSFRTMLHRERSRFRENTGLDDNITVTKIRGTNDLRIAKTAELPPATITRIDGTVEPLSSEMSKSGVLSGLEVNTED